MDPLTMLGLVAASLTTAAFVPQVLKIWKTKSAEDLSLGTFTTLCVGLILWLIYGLLKRDLPIIVSNTVTLALAMMIVGLALKYRGKKHRASRVMED